MSVVKNQTIDQSKDNQQKKSGLKGNVLTALRLLVSFGALFIIFYLFRSKLTDVLEILLTTRWELFALAYGLYVGSIAIINYRLKVVLTVKNLFISFKNVFFLGMIGLFFNNLLPSAVGGDAVKGYYLYKKTGNKLDTFSTVFVDRVIGLFTLVGLAFLGVLCFGQKLSDPKINQIVYALSLSAFLLVLFFSSRRVARLFKFVWHLIPSQKYKTKMRDVYHSIYEFKQHRKTVVSSLVLSILSQSCFVLVNFVLAKSLGVDIPLGLFFVLMPIVSAVSMAPSVNGLGVREGAYVYLFSNFCSSEQAFALSLLFFFVMFSFSLFGGLIYTFSKGIRSREESVFDEFKHAKDEIENPAETV